MLAIEGLVPSKTMSENKSKVSGGDLDALLDGKFLMKTSFQNIDFDHFPPSLGANFPGVYCM